MGAAGKTQAADRVSRAEAGVDIGFLKNIAQNSERNGQIHFRFIQRCHVHKFGFAAIQCVDRKKVRGGNNLIGVQCRKDRSGDSVGTVFALDGVGAGRRNATNENTLAAFGEITGENGILIDRPDSSDSDSIAVDDLLKRRQQIRFVIDRAEGRGLQGPIQQRDQAQAVVRKFGLQFGAISINRILNPRGLALEDRSIVGDTVPNLIKRGSRIRRFAGQLGFGDPAQCQCGGHQGKAVFVFHRVPPRVVEAKSAPEGNAF